MTSVTTTRSLSENKIHPLKRKKEIKLPIFEVIHEDRSLETQICENSDLKQQIPGSTESVTNSKGADETSVSPRIREEDINSESGSCHSSAQCVSKVEISNDETMQLNERPFFSGQIDYSMANTDCVKKVISHQELKTADIPKRPVSSQFVDLIPDLLIVQPMEVQERQTYELERQVRSLVQKYSSVVRKQIFLAVVNSQDERQHLSEVQQSQRDASFQQEVKKLGLNSKKRDGKASRKTGANKVIAENPQLEQKLRALLTLDKQPNVIEFFKSNLSLIGQLQSAKNQLQCQYYPMRQDKQLSHPNSLETLDRACPSFVFHKSKRFFSERALEAAQDYAEACQINLGSSEYLGNVIDTLIDVRRDVLNNSNKSQSINTQGCTQERGIKIPETCQIRELEDSGQCFEEAIGQCAICLNPFNLGCDSKDSLYPNQQRLAGQPQERIIEPQLCKTCAINSVTDLLCSDDAGFHAEISQSNFVTSESLN